MARHVVQVQSSLRIQALIHDIVESDVHTQTLVVRFEAPQESGYKQLFFCSPMTIGFVTPVYASQEGYNSGSRACVLYATLEATMTWPWLKGKKVGVLSVQQKV